MGKLQALACVNRHDAHEVRIACRKRARRQLQGGQVALEAIRGARKAQPQPLDILEHAQRLAYVADNGLSRSILPFKADKPAASAQQRANADGNTRAARRRKRPIEAKMGEIDLILLLRLKARKAFFVFPGSVPFRKRPAVPAPLAARARGKVQQRIIA